MLDKIKALFGSLRFWIIILGAVIAVLQSISTTGLNMVDILDIIKVTLIAIVGLGTADSIVTKFGAAIASAQVKK